MATLPAISPEIIRAYQDKLSQNASGATLKRKNISLNRFFGWAKEQGHIDENPYESLSPQVTAESQIVTTKTKARGKVSGSPSETAGPEDPLRYLPLVTSAQLLDPPAAAATTGAAG